jgi:hypothetical protein
MSDRVVRNVPAMRSLRKMNARQRNNYIKRCSPDFVRVLCECCKNLLKGNVPVSAHQTIKLRRYRNILRTLSSKKASLKTRRKLLQKGGFLPLLLGPAISFASSLLGPAVQGVVDAIRGQ